MKGFEQGVFGSKEEVPPAHVVNPETFSRTTINRAIRAAKEKFGKDFIFAEEVIDDSGNLEGVILADLSDPHRFVIMTRTEGRPWEGHELIPVPSPAPEGSN